MCVCGGGEVGGVCVGGEVGGVCVWWWEAILEFYCKHYRSQSSESTDELCPVAYFEPNKDR